MVTFFLIRFFSDIFSSTVRKYLRLLPPRCCQEYRPQRFPYPQLRVQVSNHTQVSPCRYKPDYRISD